MMYRFVQFYYSRNLTHFPVYFSLNFSYRPNSAQRLRSLLAGGFGAPAIAASKACSYRRYFTFYARVINVGTGVLDGPAKPALSQCEKLKVKKV